VCAGCHKITDPIGLSLENFDGAGAFRTTERGELIDTSGSLGGKSFANAIGLGQALHDEPTLAACLVQRSYAYGTGGAVTAADKPMLAYLDDQFARNGYRFRALLRTIALSSAFSEVEQAPAPAQTRTALMSSPHKN
jgi:hypothetical protein